MDGAADLRILSFNVENLFFSADKSLAVFQSQKDKDFPALSGLKKTIEQIEPDIAALVEVGGEKSLEDFNEHFLDSKYHCSLIPGNSDRNIHIGFLINKKLSYHFEHLTHRNRPLKLQYPHEMKKWSALRAKNPHLEAPVHYLSRDIAELRVYENPQEQIPKLIILAVHLKSKRVDQGHDFGGRLRRSAEFKLLLETYLLLDKRFHQKVPIILCGDFNGVIREKDGEAEFQNLFEQTDLIDILELLDLPEEQRVTHISFSKNKTPVGLQFDYLFFSKRFANLVDKEQSGRYLFQDEKGMPLKSPQSSAERSTLPSDHYPLVCQLDLAGQP